LTPARGRPATLAVNALAPFLLTALIARPSRLIYLSSDMHRRGDASLHDVAWRSRRWDGVQAYCDSKLLLTALAFGPRPSCRTSSSRTPSSSAWPT
jgi:hypothetical protein